MKILSKKDLAKKYRSMSNRELCKELDITNPTLVKYLKLNGIPLKGKGKRKIMVIE